MLTVLSPSLSVLPTALMLGRVQGAKVAGFFLLKRRHSPGLGLLNILLHGAVFSLSLLGSDTLFVSQQIKLA